MILLTTDDFDKFQSIAQSPFSLPLLQEYIDRYEESYIKRILGVTLGQLFITDIQTEDSASAAIDDRYLEILLPFIKQHDHERIMESKGMKDVLASLIFYHYISDNQAKHSQAGVVTNQAEVSNILSVEDATRFAEMKWNNALSSIHAIQWWCDCENAKDYPDFMGMRFHPKYSPLL